MKSVATIKADMKVYKVKKYIFLTVLVVAIFIAFCGINVKATITGTLPTSTLSTEFPASYKPYIDALKKAHPNWIFKAVNTNLDWATVIDHETYVSGGESRSLIHSSMGDEWKKNGINYYKDGSYVIASIGAVKYVMDPRNHLTESGIFQFETLSYSPNITISAIEKTLGSSPMNQAAATSGTTMGTVTATSLNVRSGASTSHSILTTISKGTYVTIISTSNGWYNIRLSNGQTGYVSAAYINIVTTSGNINYKSMYKDNNVWKALATPNTTYAEVIKAAGLKYNVSPIHIASRIIQETSGDIINNRSINGSVASYTGLYNFCNIGATPGGDGAIINGLKRARTEGWTNPIKSIEGATNFIKSGYIGIGQDTIYFQKFDVNNPNGTKTSLCSHQYMTNILAPINESKNTYNSYNRAGLLNEALEFHIPVYKNMPALAAEYPYTTYTPDNTKIFLDDGIKNGTDTFNIRLTTDDSSTSNIIAVVKEYKEGGDNRNIYTRVYKGVNTGWDKIRLSDGREGYVQSKDVKAYVHTKVTGVTLNKNNLELYLNDNQNLLATIAPTNAKYKTMVWSSSDSEVVTVNQSGNIIGNKLGTATITVTTDDQSKVATCIVDVVNSNVSGITVAKSEYVLLKDSYLTITPNILPTIATDKTYTITSANELIVKVEDEKIKGVAVGETNITFTTTDGSKTVTCLIKVVDLPEGDNAIIDSSLVNTSGIITKVSPGTKVSSLKEKFLIQSTNTMELRTAANVLILDTANVGTGNKVVIKNSLGAIISTYNLVIYGDVSGDGIINLVDALKIQKHYVGLESLIGENLKAASITKRTEEISLLDALKIQKYYVGLNDIVQ